ncbi:hypothetical protein HDU97_005192 [Phlyctochytrium planicorne]|nr:hypothetical protein HDU97_005192 [Phlyctochytrium planicorne]
MTDGSEILDDALLCNALRDDSTVVVSSGEDFIGAVSSTFETNPSLQMIVPDVIFQDGVLICLFPDVNSLQSAFGRAHVFYEGGTLKGPLKGVNMPTRVYFEWTQNANTGSLSEQELSFKALIAGGWKTHVDGLVRANDTSVDYIIASLVSDASTVLHEWAHARFFMDASYREACEKAFSELDDNIRIAIEKELAMWNYKPSVFVDEFHAYVVEDPSSFGKRWESSLREAHLLLKSLCGPAPVIRRSKSKR